VREKEGEKEKTHPDDSVLVGSQHTMEIVGGKEKQLTFLYAANARTTQKHASWVGRTQNSDKVPLLGRKNSDKRNPNKKEEEE
jgi:hypothetical protein